MKYIIRSLKYFLYLVIVLALTIVVLYLVGWVEGDLASIFKNGYDSFWQIGIIIAIFAIIYPRFGFVEKHAFAPGEYNEIRQDVIALMQERGYSFENEEGETIIFHRRSPISRALKMFEDKITVSHDATGFNVEGLSRDVVRIVSAIENKFSLPPQD
ncbi:MAG: hypothetical protein IJU27_02185 [Bacteroidales bacterium]|nr:hypothetical protein [Bacteroidales bacterium]